MDSSLETAQAHNAQLTGAIEPPVMRPDHPTLPNVETLNYRYFRANVGFAKSEKWLKLIRDYPCVECGAPAPSGPHHVAGGYHGIKTSDFAAIPVCRRCHEEIERDKDKHNRAVFMLALFYAKFMEELYGMEK